MGTYFPAEISIEVFITDGENSGGKATIGMGIGIAPTCADIKSRISKFESEELKELGGGYRLMTRHEMMKHVSFEETGQRFAIGGKDSFDECPACNCKTEVA